MRTLAVDARDHLYEVAMDELLPNAGLGDEWLRVVLVRDLAPNHPPRQDLWWRLGDAAAAELVPVVDDG